MNNFDSPLSMLYISDFSSIQYQAFHSFMLELSQNVFQLHRPQGIATIYHLTPGRASISAPLQLMCDIADSCQHLTKKAICVLRQDIRQLTCCLLVNRDMAKTIAVHLDRSRVKTPSKTFQSFKGTKSSEYSLKGQSHQNHSRRQ